MNEIHVENDYFPLPSKFEMYNLDFQEQILVSSIATWVYTSIMIELVTNCYFIK
jgi:hypothetical protein